MKPIDTQRIHFRPLTADDLSFVHGLVQDPEVIRYLMRTPTPLEEIRELELPVMLFTAEDSPGTGHWIAEHVGSGEPFGWFGLTPAPSVRNLELSYRLARSAWGLGLATEGSVALLAHAFNALAAETVWAQTMFVNAGSRRVMQKLGMRPFHSWHELFEEPLPGHEYGEVAYEIAREEWLRLRLP